MPKRRRKPISIKYKNHRKLPQYHNQIIGQRRVTSSNTVAELRQIIRVHGIPVSRRSRKQGLIKAINSYFSGRRVKIPRNIMGQIGKARRGKVNKIAIYLRKRI